MPEQYDQTRVQRVTVEPDEAGRRLDNFLLSRLRGVPRSRVYRMVRSGEVRVNRGRARPDTRLSAGDEVRIPPVRVSPARVAGPGESDGGLRDRILYEDRDLLAINKPAGMAVHGGSGISLGVIERLRTTAQRPDDLSLVHRLDRDTSGCLLIAKRRASLRELHRQFRDGEVHKRYRALLVGRMKPGTRNVDAPLQTNHRRGGERHVIVDAAGKASLTWFEPEEHFPGYTLCGVRLDTGRTHQIRVHAAHIGHPVAGDTRYGPPAPKHQPGPDIGLRRLFLHAEQLSFDSPSDGRVIRIEAPLDKELTQVVARLRRGDTQ